MDVPFEVLIVDDQPFAREGLISHLNWKRFHGTLCGSVSNGAEAMDFLQVCHPDAIISDIKMPHMDGIELAKKVHESPELTDIPIILLSAYQEFEYAQKAMSYHVNHYILKPITRKKIEQMEDILVELYRARETSRVNLINFTNGNWIKEVSKALYSHDISKIENFFQSSSFLDFMEGKHCDILGTQLIGCLYDYLADLHFEPNALQASRNNSIESFCELPNTAQKSNYIETLYMDVLNFFLQKRGNNTDALYRYAISYIDANFTDINFSISKMAAEMNITLSYLSRVFKQSTGNNLINYVTEKRIDYAKTLLKSPQYSIRKAAHLCGYADDGYFSSLFRRKTGMTPTEYRNCQL